MQAYRGAEIPWATTVSPGTKSHASCPLTHRPGLPLQPHGTPMGIKTDLWQMGSAAGLSRQGTCLAHRTHDYDREH